MKILKDYQIAPKTKVDNSFRAINHCLFDGLGVCIGKSHAWINGLRYSIMVPANSQVALLPHVRDTIHWHCAHI